MNAELTNWTKRILNTYGEGIRARIERGEDPVDAFRAAVEYEQTKLRELIACETEWAKQKRAEITDTVYHTLRKD